MSERLQAARPLLFVLAALGLSQLIVWTILGRPPEYDTCSQQEAPPGQPAELREFRFPAYVLTLLVMAYGIYNLLAWSRAARVRRGGPDRPTEGALAASVVVVLIALGLGVDTLNVRGEDVGGLGLGLIFLGVAFVPPVIVGAAVLAVVVSLFAPADRWRTWLDRTGPIALGIVLTIVIPFVYGLVLVRGGDAALC